MPLEYRHDSILPRLAANASSRPDRNRAPAAETMSSMFRRRREMRKIRLAARMLLVLGRP
jgi:hypothetical protein